LARGFLPDDLPLPRSPLAGVIIAAVLVALIGRLDYDTGYGTSVIVLYLLPVALATWVAGPAWGIAAALGSAVLSLLGDLLVVSSHGSLVPYWNAAVQFSVFALFALALAALRASLTRERLASRVDYVSGLANWRAFAEVAEAEIARMRRFGRPLTLVYTDCDDFKDINDRFGHGEGDRVLRQIGASLRDTTREVDTVARLGGDEFVVMLPETGPEAADRAVKRMRDRIRETMSASERPVTLSFGVATFCEPPASLDVMVGSADHLLYQAKRSGRDRAMLETFGKRI
jgi:diguanylate cyclase (GGDEF)-like protein